jgi:hypothetical protein
MERGKLRLDSAIGKPREASPEREGEPQAAESARGRVPMRAAVATGKETVLPPPPPLRVKPACEFPRTGLKHLNRPNVTPNRAHRTTAQWPVGENDPLG